jgi:NADPH:quinone reductase-like Zn-dependent oxidoreductase
MTSADKHIRAWTFTHEGYPKALRRSTLTSPSIPAAPEIHVRVKAAALNPVDIQLMNLPVWKYLPGSIVPSDKGIGKDFAGIVEAAGRNSGFDVGDEVRYCTHYTIIRSYIQCWY